MTKHITILLAAATLLLSCHPNLQKSSRSEREMNRYISALMHKMTLEEKVGQLSLPVGGDITTGEPRLSNTAEDIRSGHVGGLFNLKGAEQIREVQRIAVEESRLGIPLLFGMDVIHGYETIFPIPLGMSCSWDMDAIEHAARIAAIEATADGICWTFSPMVDISHDGRWGRISEGSGEDPYLGARIAEVMVRGYQTDQLADSTSMLACVKHFALYGAVEGGREYNFVDMSRYRMFNEYMAPYEAAVKAGAGSVMAAFNVVEGVPCHGNKWLLTDVLREQWGFKGFVVADYTGIEHLQDNGVTPSHELAAIQAIQAGLDMDMASSAYQTLIGAVRNGKVSVATIDDACRRILEAKYKLGLFEDPYRYCHPARRAVVRCAEHREAARKIAAESMVLLKNEGNLLPLAKHGTIALIGPLADARTHMAGTWSVAAVHEHYKTLREGMADALQGTGAELLYAKGSNLMYDAEQEGIISIFGHDIRDSRSAGAMREEALNVARKADVIVCAMGEGSESAGECASRVNIELYDAQRDLLAALLKLGKPIVLLHFAGRPTVLEWESKHVPAIIETWFSGSEGADAIADVLFGDINPSGHLTTQLPHHVGQYPFSYRYYRTSRPNTGGTFGKYSTCYQDVSTYPLYPFGYGLSYTDFEVSEPVWTKQAGDTIGIISTTITNTGHREGATVLQLYLSDPFSEGVRPYIELCGFERISLKAGESQIVTFAITPDMLAYYNPKGIKTIEPGEYQLRVGLNSRDLSKPVIFQL